jgi:hypothetical protein
MNNENTFEYNHDPDLMHAFNKAYETVERHAKRTGRDVGLILSGDISRLTAWCKPLLRNAIDFIQQYDVYEDLRERYYQHIGDERNSKNSTIETLWSSTINNQREVVIGIAQKLGIYIDKPDYSDYDLLEL